MSTYVSEGAEQKVFLQDETTVRKLNDGIYYSSWKDYFYNLLLHNLFFPDTSYSLIGFTKIEGVLYAIVEQPFIISTSITNLDEVKAFMADKGFVNSRNNDYVNSDIGIILEDLHDENVLTSHGYLCFIDTVFFLTDSFWEE